MKSFVEHAVLLVVLMFPLFVDSHVLVSLFRSFETVLETYVAILRNHVPIECAT